ncbi:hypothetical protein [Ferriphaselus sp. R-1]|uniref:hypothetical protein n=1 Tax=Ferriphaselus sp. R-1 TaxID=1485544 RepID=UPI00054EFF42|nr:hypothetical protein [Ferriphaselus sp. R-1]
MKKNIAILVAAMLVTGCGYVTNRYSMSADNVMAARSWNGVMVNVGNFTEAPNTKASCNYKGPINTIDGESYGQFVRNALVSELTIAGAYSESAPITITGRLDRLDNATAFDTSWSLDVTLTSSNGKSASVKETYKYHGSIVGTTDSTCSAAAAGFVPAVQNLVGKMIREIPKSLL